MSVADVNKAALRGLDDLINSHDLTRLAEFVTEDVVDHGIAPGLPPGIEGKRLSIEGLLSAFPDLHIAIEDMVADGDRVAERLTMQGTHLGDMAGIPATGRTVNVSALAISRMVDGKQAEHWFSMDQLDVMRQLGVMPSD